MRDSVGIVYHSTLIFLSLCTFLSVFLYLYYCMTLKRLYYMEILYISKISWRDTFLLYWTFQQNIVMNDYKILKEAQNAQKTLNCNVSLFAFCHLIFSVILCNFIGVLGNLKSNLKWRYLFPLSNFRFRIQYLKFGAELFYLRNRFSYPDIEINWHQQLSLFAEACTFSEKINRKFVIF